MPDRKKQAQLVSSQARYRLLVKDVWVWEGSIGICGEYPGISSHAAAICCELGKGEAEGRRNIGNTSGIREIDAAAVDAAGVKSSEDPLNQQQSTLRSTLVLQLPENSKLYAMKTEELDQAWSVESEPSQGLW
ncbi:hypothetical protein UY3_02761 [Chelonia mydas]|uniref:Uncharacterized protein n=1 Tax=Chelonia mydas TaxID=8469 RepID=M7BPZ9_CHEMY|nr:hypothetical protein UY3_02761 [Chelonia mydas]